MQIECDIEGIDPQPPLIEFFNRVLHYAARRVSLDLAAVGRVVIVSAERFGAVVHSIRPGATHTHTEIAVAGGKTMPRREGDRIVSDIVLQCFLFEALAPVLAGSSPASCWDEHQEQAFYVICHEFGHAIDHTVRNDMSEVADPRASPFSIRETAEYYGIIVLTEYAACRLSASGMTDRLFGLEMKEATHRMNDCGRQIHHYLDNPELLTPRALAHFVCQGAWVYMVELTKLYEYAVAIQREAAVREIEMERLKATPLGDYLDHLRAAHPAWDIPREIDDLTDVWLQHAAVLGVQFETRDDGPDAMVKLPQR